MLQTREPDDRELYPQWLVPEEIIWLCLTGKIPYLLATTNHTAEGAMELFVQAAKMYCS
jgi:hypothetical protein